MSNAKRNTLIAVQAIIVILFVVAVLFGMGATSVKAYDVQISRDGETTAADMLEDLTVNGHVPASYDPAEKYANSASSPLRDAQEIQSFLLGNKIVEKKDASGNFQLDPAETKAKIGYLIEDNIQFSWSNAMTNKFMANGLTFDGNGKTINLTANSLNESPWQSITSFQNEAANTFLKAKNYHTDVDVNGAFIGCIPLSSKIINTNFVYNSQITGTQKTAGSGCGGFIAGYCNGKIDNCSVTVQSAGSYNFTKQANTSNTDISRHSYAFGGFVGMLVGSNSAISNSSLYLANGSSLYIKVTPTTDKDKAANARIFLGGIAGWMGDSAQAYNLRTDGLGTLEANFDGKQSTVMGQVGIVAGCCASDEAPTDTNAITGTALPGRINGVINTWEGYAKCFFNEGKYAPTDASGTQAIKGMIVGMSGVQLRDSETNLVGQTTYWNIPSNDETVTNVYCVGDLYEKSEAYTIGHSYAIKDHENPAPRKKLCNVINFNCSADDPTASNANVVKNQLLQYAYLTWADTTRNSDVLAVWDIGDDPLHILWATDVEKKNADGSVGERVQESYFWRSETFEEAKSYDLTCINLIRGNYPTVNINFEFGRAAYIEKVFKAQKAGEQDEVITDSVSHDAAIYGNRLDIPEIRLYTDPDYAENNTAPVRTIPSSDYSYWRTLKGSSKNLNPTNDCKDVGEYTTFLYLEDAADGTDYTNIHLLDRASHIVAYIKDDANYQDFARQYKDQMGTEFSHVNVIGSKRIKNFDWQPRITQKIEPKPVHLSYQKPRDVDMPNDKVTGIPTAEYQGQSVVFTASVLQEELETQNGYSDSAVTATLEYYSADDDFTFDEERNIPTAIDVGNYLVHPVSLSNSNYTIASDVEDYRFAISKRVVNFRANPAMGLPTQNALINSDGVCSLNLTYNGSEQLIQFGIREVFNASYWTENPKWAFLLYSIGSNDLDGLVNYKFYSMYNTEIYDAINVPEDEDSASYQLIIRFSDGIASSNYALLSNDKQIDEIKVIVTIAPAQVQFESPADVQKDFTYGERALDNIYFAYGIGVDGKANVEPNYVRYYKWNSETSEWEHPYNLEDDEWEEIRMGEPSANKPQNVGRYKVVYKISNENNRNYANSISKGEGEDDYDIYSDEVGYEVNIAKRTVQFTASKISSQYVIGKLPNTIGGGAYEEFTANDDANRGLLVDHGRNYEIGFRYQYIGAPVDESGQDPTYTKLTDMSKIVSDEYTYSRIRDIGCYVVYPVLLLPCNKPDEHDHHGEQYVYDPERCNNYNFELQTRIVNVHAADVVIEIENIKKEYSKFVPDLIIDVNNNANSTIKWKYQSGSITIRSYDNIVIHLKTTANERSEVEVEADIELDYYEGEAGIAGNPNGNKASNYNITVISSKLTVIPLDITVQTNLGAETSRTFTYGDAIPTMGYEVISENKFMASDDMDSSKIWVYTIDGQNVGEPKNVGTYGISIDFSSNEYYKNYNISVITDHIVIVPREISIDEFKINANAENINEAGEFVFTYNGQIQRPEAIITFNNLVDGDNIIVGYDFFLEGQVDPVDEPKNVGVYTAKVKNLILNEDGTPNNNYVLVLGEGDTDFDTATVKIERLEINVKVNNATRVYHIPASLQALKKEIELTEGFDPNGLSDDDYTMTGELPYSLGLLDKFVDDDITYALYVEDYYEDLGIARGAVSIIFSGPAIDADNYQINVVPGDLLVIPATFEQIDNFLFVTYEGKRIGRDIKPEEIVYTGANLFNKFGLFARNEALYEKMDWTFTDEDGNDVNGVIQNAGIYKMVITGDGETFEGSAELTFEVNKAVRNLTLDDIVIKVHYDRIEISSSIPGLGYKVNKGAIQTLEEGEDVFVYDNVKPSNNYYIEISVFVGDDNYYESNTLSFMVETGINASDLASRINAIQTITFSNLSTYRALKAQLGDVHQDDMYLIDSDKIAALDASLNKLLSDASAVVSGAQSVTAKATGKSNNSTSATAMALSSASLGLGAIGLMLGIVAKKRKEDEEVEPKAKKTNGKRYAKRFVIVLSIMLIAVMVFAGCKDSSMKQEDLLNLASYKTPSNETSREYEITVSHGSTIVYRNENGKETTNENVSAPKFELGATGTGLDFNVEYFSNISYVTSKSTASFNADVTNVDAFLGRPNATNASVTAIADIQNNRLTSIEISYNEGEFKTQIVITLIY